MLTTLKVVSFFLVKIRADGRGWYDINTVSGTQAPLSLCSIIPRILLLSHHQIYIPAHGSVCGGEVTLLTLLVSYTHQFYLHSIGQSLVTWPLAARGAGKCSL